MKKFYENFVLRSTEDGGENNGGDTNPNVGEGENDENEQEYVDPNAEDDSAMYEDEESTIDGGTIPEVDVVAPVLPPEGEDEEGDGGEGGDETITEPDEGEDNSEGEGDVEEDSPETEEKSGDDQGSDGDTIVSPERPATTWDKPEPTRPSFCLIGCCLWALYRLLGYRPTFACAQAIADRIANNNGLGYPASCAYRILTDICDWLGRGDNFTITPIVLNDYVSIMANLRNLHESGVQIIFVLFGEKADHAVLVAGFGSIESGVFCYIDPDTGRYVYTSISNTTIDRLYLIRKN